MDRLHRFAPLLQNRLALYFMLLGIQGLFFVTNGLNSVLRAPDDGLELKIPAIDNHIVPNGAWLIPYTIGIFLTALLPLWAAYHMPVKLYRQYVFAMALAACTSYVIYIVFPTYAVKPQVDDIAGSGLLSHLLRVSYEMDNNYSTHNAAPSQHVFYAIINMCFMIRFRPQKRSFLAWTALAASISASALLTRQHRSPDLIAGYMMAVAAYWMGLYLGQRVTEWLKDEDQPIVLDIPECLGGPRRERRKARSA